MKAYKCDICGRFYESESKYVTIKKQNVSLVYYTGSGDFVLKADICPYCTDALQKIINERNASEEVRR